MTARFASGLLRMTAEWRQAPNKCKRPARQQTASSPALAGNAPFAAARWSRSRAGRVTKVAPNPQHLHSKGAFCIKGIRGATDHGALDININAALP
jgi:hypothetical protein